MIVDIGYTSDPINKVVKNFTVVKSVSANMKADTSVINPIFELSKIDISSLKGLNYLYIADLGRYYYIDNITMGIGGIAILECHIDVLMSYSNNILNLSCVIARNENVYNAYLDDDKFNIYKYPRIQTKTFPNGFSDISTLVLTVVGGGN